MLNSVCKVAMIFFSFSKKAVTAPTAPPWPKKSLYASAVAHV